MGTIEMDSHVKPHAVCIPFPAQGHISPMLKLAKLLHLKGFHITFVNTEFNHQRLLKSRGSESLKGFNDFQFKTISDGLQSSDISATQDIASLCASSSKNCLVPFRNLIAELNDFTSSSAPPVSCIVSDAIMSFTLQVAQELNVPGVLFRTTSACAFMCSLHVRRLIQDGLLPLKDESDLRNGYLETPISSCTGLTNIRLRDLPSYIRTTDPNNVLLKFACEEAERTYNASAVIFNTFEELEVEVLQEMKQIIPPMYTIGPLQLLLNKIKPNAVLNSIGSNLWTENSDCIKWLDTKEPNTVLYVNFGSVAVMTLEQLMEFAWGLANSGHSFLWIIRPDLVRGEKTVLPLEFLNMTKTRSLISSWCAQEQVLSHRSIGGFLTHSGWNSTVEAVCGGVPVICWPFFADQFTNCRYACTKWGIGLEVNGEVKRGDVESLVRELMEGEKGRKLRETTMEWKKKAYEATSPGGSSYENLDRLVKEVLNQGKVDR